MFRQEFDILHHSAWFFRTVWQRNLPSPKPQPFCLPWKRSRRVQAQKLLRSPPDHLIHGLAPNLAQQIPQRKVDTRDGCDRETLTPVEQRRAVHLVPQHVCVARVCAQQEAREVLVHEPARRGAAEPRGKPGRPGPESCGKVAL